MRGQQDQIQSMYISTKRVAGMEIPLITDEVKALLEDASGRIAFPLTNDRAFRGIVSYSPYVRDHLAAILLGMPADQIGSVTMLNPISFGQDLAGKETEEDVRLLVNGNLMLDIELQNLYLNSNKKRFLLYLCRNYDSLRQGASYNELKSNLFVGIMNYNFDEEVPEFFSQYRIMNKKTNRPLFQDDDYFGVNVINLRQTKLADYHDKISGRLLLANLFRAETWEELRQLGQKSEFAQEVAYIMCASNADVREKIALDAARRHDELLATIRDDAARAQREMEAAKKEIEEARQQTKEARQQTEEARQQTEEARQKTKEAQQQAEEARRDADNQRARADALEEELLSLRAKMDAAAKE